MSHMDYAYLLSERETVRALLADTPEEDVIDRYSLQGRLAVIERRMQQVLAAAGESAGQEVAAGVPVC